MMLTETKLGNKLELPIENEPELPTEDEQFIDRSIFAFWIHARLDYCTGIGFHWWKKATLI